MNLRRRCGTKVRNVAALHLFTFNLKCLNFEAQFENAEVQFEKGEAQFEKDEVQFEIPEIQFENDETQNEKDKFGFEITKIQFEKIAITQFETPLGNYGMNMPTCMSNVHISHVCKHR